MKIRIKGNSLRYRLTKTDVDNLAKNSFLEEQINFVGKTFKYVLKSTAVDVMTADFNYDTITLFMPHNMMTELTKTNKIGFDATDGQVQLLVEKDFTCLENVEEDQSDNYPNPLAVKYLA